MKHSSYCPAVVNAFFKEQGIPEPVYEYRFCDSRKWRFDLSWPTMWYRIWRKPPLSSPADFLVEHPVSVEVQGGLFIAGGHNRGAAMLKEHEKRNEAACLGWRILYCQPSELCTVAFATTIKRALNL